MQKYWFILPVLLLLTSCLAGPVRAGQSEATPVPTDCGCSLEGPGKLTLEPSDGLANPAGPPLNAGTPDANVLESFRDRWLTYDDPQVGFSFEYPAAFSSAEYKFCAPRVDDFPPDGVDFALNFGSRTNLTVAAADNDNLSAAVSAFRADPRHADYSFEPQQEREVAGLPGISLPYRSSGTDRYAEVTIFTYNGALYTIETGVPSACDIPELGLTEISAYDHLLGSLKFK